MRKLIYTLILFLLTRWGATAQFFTDWHDPSEWQNAFINHKGGKPLTERVNFLMPDSLAQCIDSSGNVLRDYTIVAGIVIDAKDDAIDLTDNPNLRMSKFTRYSAESFFLRYLYVRTVDTLSNGSKVTDTLFVSYIDSRKMTRNTAQSPAGAPFAYAMPFWNINTLQPDSMVARDTILLTDADRTFVEPDSSGTPESSWSMKTMQKQIRNRVIISPGDNNYVSMIFRFKPGMPYDTGAVMFDQRNPASIPAGRKRVNYFGYSCLVNLSDTNAQWLSNRYVNHALFSYPNNAYYAAHPQINNNWSGFIPGNAYAHGQTIHCGMGLEIIHFEPIGLNNLNLISEIGLYPNPATSSVNVSFTLKQQTEVSIHISDLLGRQVVSSQAGILQTGHHTLTTELQELNAGLYYVHLTANGTTSATRLVVTE